MSGEWLGRGFFERSPVECAAGLIGMELRWDGSGGIIVETEAYAALGDEACHTFFRKAARSFVASHGAGAAYVYLNYGMHWLFNVLTKGPEGEGFVLVRALRPTVGIEVMQRRRAVVERHLCAGPGCLTAALGIDGGANGEDFLGGGRERGIFQQRQPGVGQVIADRRIGISRSAELPWRFLLAGSSHVSRKAGRHAAIWRG